MIYSNFKVLLRFWHPSFRSFSMQICTVHKAGYTIVFNHQCSLGTNVKLLNTTAGLNPEPSQSGNSHTLSFHYVPDLERHGAMTDLAILL